MNIPLEAIKAFDLYIREIKDPKEIYGMVYHESDQCWYIRLPCILREGRQKVINQISWNRIKSYLDWLDNEAQTNFLNIEDDWERTFHNMSFSVLGELYLSKKLLGENDVK